MREADTVAGNDDDGDDDDDDGLHPSILVIYYESTDGNNVMNPNYDCTVLKTKC